MNHSVINKTGHHTTHYQNIDQQFSPQAQAYLHSTVHANGDDLQQLAQRLSQLRPSSVLDLGCGAGHASFTAAASSGQLIACDLSVTMLDTVAETARQRHIHNITTCQAAAESLPFAEQAFDLVISRYSAHHWQHVPQALYEISRVLRPGGCLLLIDIISPGQPLTDIWLQTIEALRDPSHVRDYSSGEWLTMINRAGLATHSVHTYRVALDFNSWITRMRTPAALADAIRHYQQTASSAVKQHFALQSDGSFTSDAAFIEAHKSDQKTGAID